MNWLQGGILNILRGNMINLYQEDLIHIDNLGKWTACKLKKDKKKLLFIIIHRIPIILS